MHSDLDRTELVVFTIIRSKTFFQYFAVQIHINVADSESPIRGRHARRADSVHPQELRERQIAHPYATHVVRCTSVVKPGSERLLNP
jgi:hypothetical protein